MGLLPKLIPSEVDDLVKRAEERADRFESKLDTLIDLLQKLVDQGN
ncbi:hypothetical protein SEA_LITTLELAF_20 [Mycobacterium phage LittleLaf]|uniref:Uncharacterized protein n=13 Tax=Marvinvirus TaxID=1982091 RepID=A0A3S9U918_9CAUD|nr:hypothetical protein FH33_gp019 [Mycobacterium phage MosMoris]YP_009614137.1 hypothetical protein FDI61_gp019 [Mycobacterium phage Marvin]ANM46243.1 hypothetical protein SEA_GATTACA_20 [Mycobacterium phage Gattaca]AVE00766.1 hypothetical protein SEA_TESLA_20 [Mycobacterium phage Tesla]AYB69829.1 hypothetical protein SEA_LITTLELAF_20 [Mycobacterium phage LittleLaf]AYB70657.1 hypothetical protein SEA_VASUNZINGA_19 [Mycobacterium phage VasuNzinga]AZF93289.1 hypothetical protein SEA_BEELZEBUB_